jgi:hypothetical protein
MICQKPSFPLVAAEKHRGKPREKNSRVHGETPCFFHRVSPWGETLLFFLEKNIGGSPVIFELTSSFNA